MARSAQIGALRVALGLDSAQFETGLRNAQSGLSRFGSMARTAMIAAAAAAAAASAALAVTVKQSIDAADAMSKMAQKVGISVEALSRLNYAAGLSDVSLEQLGGGLRRLSNSMTLVATGAGGTLKTAFDALGVSATNADGSMRTSTAVLADIADRFSRMEDGVTKTSIAMQIFGRAGTDLIPMLNAGHDGLAEMALESDNLGMTLSTRAARAAEEFNDNLTRLQSMFRGMINQVMEGIIPALANMSSKFIEVAMNGDTMKKIAEGIINTLKVVASAALLVGGAIATVTESIAVLWLAIEKRARGENVEQFLADGFGGVNQTIQETIDTVGKLWAEYEAGPQTTGEVSPFEADLVAVTNAASAATEATKEAERAAKELQDRWQSVFDATRTPFEAMHFEISALREVLDETGADFEMFGRAASAAMANATSSVAGSLGGLVGDLSAAFEKNKAFAVATAVLKGVEAVASAFAAGNAIGGPVVGAIYAGIAGITAAANVAAVANTTSSSKSMGGAGGGTPSVGTPAAAQRQVGGTIIVHGNQSDFNMVEGVVKGITELINADGANDLVLAVQRAQR